MSILRTMTFGVLILSSGLAQAARIVCEEYSGYPGENSSIALSGAISVGADVPVGTVVYTASYKTATPSGIRCTAPDEPDGGDKISNIRVPYRSVITSYPYPEVPGMTVDGNQVYRTNLDGIGVYFRLSSGSADTVIGGGIVSGRYETTRMYLVKTGPVSPGMVDGSSLPATGLEYTKPDNPEHTFEGFPIRANNLRYLGTLNVVASTCDLAESDIIVPMGSYDVSSFTGTGSATAWKDASIRLQNCTAFSPGTYSKINNTISHTGPGTFPTGVPDVKNRVQLRISPATPIIDYRQGIMKIASSADAAEGVGIQLGVGTDIVNPIVLSGFFESELPDSTSNTLTIPLKARYIETRGPVKPGVANGAVTFTVSYY